VSKIEAQVTGEMQEKIQFLKSEIWRVGYWQLPCYCLQVALDPCRIGHEAVGCSRQQPPLPQFTSTPAWAPGQLHLCHVTSSRAFPQHCLPLRCHSLVPLLCDLQDHHLRGVGPGRTVKTPRSLLLPPQHEERTTTATATTTTPTTPTPSVVLTQSTNVLRRMRIIFCG
jgi:hypothetical protein